MRLPRDPRLRQFGARLARSVLGQGGFARLRARWIAPEEFERLCQIRLDHLVGIDQPLALISQIQRSGGTLLSQLFDGHPQCHAHPYELKVGRPDESVWPSLDLHGDAETWFNQLYETSALKQFKKGYHKSGRDGRKNSQYYPFILPSVLQRAIFHKSIAATSVRSQRDVLNCYMTSYFNAWLDNHNLYGGSKKLVTAFTPRLNMREASLERFFDDYPDGCLISIIREPKSWFVSARKHSPSQYGDLGEALRLWASSARAMLTAKERYGARVYLLCFEELLGAPEATLRALARYLGLDFDSCLLSPTFNNMPIKADSSFPMDEYGLLKDPILRSQGRLAAGEAAAIDQQAGELYQQVLSSKDSGER